MEVLKKTDPRIPTINLDEVVVKVLSKESEANLSQPERNIYNRYKVVDDDGVGLKLPNLDLRGIRGKGNIGRQDRRTVDAFQAMQMVKDSGIKNIFNVPQMGYGLFKDAMNIVENKQSKYGVKRPKYKSFRAHANPLSQSIYVQNPALELYMRDVFSEASHMPKYKNPYANPVGFAYGALKTLTGKQKEMYKEPRNYESYTHDVIEPALIEKYSTKT